MSEVKRYRLYTRTSIVGGNLMECHMLEDPYGPYIRYAVALAERDNAHDYLRRHGHVPCDIPACNCGSWHHRYGLPERWSEITYDLAEAGHPLTNENGHILRKALGALIAERNAALAEIERLRALIRRELPFARVEGRKTWLADATEALRGEEGK